MARPDPALGYFNGELRFWLGWAQEVGGDHAAAQESWRQARSELEPFLKEQPENYNLMRDLALVEMGLGNKAAALSMAERAMAANPIEKDVVDGPAPIEILARVAAQTGEPDRAIAALQKLLSIPYEGALPAATRRSLLRCSGSIRCSIRSGMIRVFKNSLPTSRRYRLRPSHERQALLLRRAETAQCPPHGWIVSRRRVGPRTGVGEGAAGLDAGKMR